MDTDPDCQGLLKGDPDIAGRGVTAAIWTTSGIALCFSWLLWYLAFFRDKSHENSKLYRAFTKCAYSLADIQLATALAIIATSIVLIESDPDTPLYHLHVARCLIDSNFAGHGAALLFDTHRQRGWHWRLGLLFVTLVLYIFCTGRTIHEFNSWSYRTPRCFHNTSFEPGSYTAWMYTDFPWTTLGYAWVFAEAFDTCEPLLERLNRLSDALSLQPIEDLSELTQAGNGLKGWSELFAYLKTTLSSTMKLLGFLVLTPFITPPFAIPFWSTTYLAWSIYDAEMARNANRPYLVAYLPSDASTSLQGNTNPEDDWGFGQLLPMFLLILPMLQIVDAISEGVKPPQSTSVRSLATKIRDRRRPRSNNASQGSVAELTGVSVGSQCSQSQISDSSRGVDLAQTADGRGTTTAIAAGESIGNVSRTNSSRVEAFSNSQAKAS